MPSVLQIVDCVCSSLWLNMPGDLFERSFWEASHLNEHLRSTDCRLAGSEIWNSKILDSVRGLNWSGFVLPFRERISPVRHTSNFAIFLVPSQACESQPVSPRSFYLWWESDRYESLTLNTSKSFESLNYKSFSPVRAVPKRVWFISSNIKVYLSEPSILGSKFWS